MSLAATIAIGILAALILLGAPIAFALGVAGAAGLLNLLGPDGTLGVLGATPHSTVARYELVLIPMFMLMAQLALASGITEQLFTSAKAWVGRTPAGLAVATALAGAAFGAICGSSTASAATLASTSIPAMTQRGYEPRFASGVVAISGTLAMLIPPSLSIVLYGLLSEQPIDKLLIAGIIPGLVVTLTIILTVLYLVWRDPSLAPAVKGYTIREKISSLRVTGPFVLLMLFVTGTIYLGLATPTEASAFGAFGAFAIALARRSLTFPALIGALTRAVGTSVMISMMIIGALIFGYFLTLSQIPQSLAAHVVQLDVPKWAIMLVIIGIYIFLGFFMDQAAIMILTVPIFIPIVSALGYDLIWFGIMVVIVSEIGMLTPPVGLNVFVVARSAGMRVEDVFTGSWPHVFAHLVVIAVFFLFPQLILWLPSTMN
jgi:tripartite ATP-independent transporter DctM subunit